MKKRCIACVAILSVALVPGLSSGLAISTPQAHAAATIEMQRLYNPNSGEHFYTASTFERDHLVDVGWNHEGVGWVAPETSATPVYRLYNANAGDHHYTTSVVERDHLISVGWNDEGVGWYSDDAQGVPLHRQYNPNAIAGSHNYTTSGFERDHLISVGWNDEGIAWYGVDMNANQDAPDNPSTPSNPSTPDNPDNPNTPTNPDTPTPPSSEQAIANVKQYSYKITPVNGKLNEYFFVETDNPDPASFQFVDSQSKYVDDAGSAHIRPELRTFGDVVYTNADTYRIANKGYLFRDESGKTDGGSLDLVAMASDNVYGYTYDTGVTVNCPELEDDVDYLIRTYAADKGSFTEKIQAIDLGLSAIALYPKQVLDSSKRGDPGFACLAASPYPELNLNTHVENMYQGGGSLLINTVYGFVLDSAGFPAMVRAAAKRIQPDCEFRSISHAYFEVRYNGQTVTCGGKGEGSTHPLYTEFVEKTFRFDGTDRGFGTDFSMDVVRAKRLEYAAKSDEFVSMELAKLSNSSVAKNVGGGAWIRIACEGTSAYSKNYAYVTYAGENNVSYASDAWIDGRYVNNRECFESGAKFTDHPTASIILHDVTYVDNAGKTRTTDVTYVYNSQTDQWETWNFFYSPRDQLVLTRAQVNAMVASGQIDGNTATPPPAKYIYDGTAEPGTPCG